MIKRATALASAALLLASALLVARPARADIGATLFFLFCKRQQVERFEPSTGEIYPVEKWVCSFP